MAKTPKPAVRIDGSKRTNLTELSRRRKLNRSAAQPVEDTRVADAWAREEARGASAKLDRAERLAAIALPAKVVESAVTVEDPEFSRDHEEGKLGNRRFARATLNILESAITTLAAKGAINPSQLAAATKFRQHWETLGGAGAGAIDYSREQVDGGLVAEPLSTAALLAGQELHRAFLELKSAYGVHGYNLVVRVVGEGYSIHDLCATRRQRDTMTDNLRACLDVLAALWGFSTGEKVMPGSLSKIA